MSEGTVMPLEGTDLDNGDPLLIDPVNDESFRGKEKA
jgi:hypothetical protein